MSRIEARYAHEPKYCMSLRIPLPTFGWIALKAASAGVPPAIYALRRLQELARQDLVTQDQHDGGSAE
jgi:hypothetical protein